MSVPLKNPAEIEIIRRACRIQSEILNAVCSAVAIGVSTGELDELAEKLCRARNVRPAFKNYHGFPAAICASVNDEVVHSIPSAKKILKNGDIIAIDFGVVLDGWNADSCRTVGVGEISAEAKNLMERTKESLYRGIEKAVAGNSTGDIGHAIESFVKQFGYSPVRETVGHGIGRKLHEDPEVPNWGKAGSGVKLAEGMVICIEPIVNAGGAEILTEKDKWTTRTMDGNLSAHFEHQILIREGAAEILTPWDELVDSL
ncbi:type I methionyl aminopeptidase [Patescibacteria group bacterium]|nr:type I methionyl aminopeptidase [Patescibacteria group bacterium]